MTAGADSQQAVRPAPYTGERGRAETEYYMSFYRCPCQSRPEVSGGRVKVVHWSWCPIHKCKKRYGLCTT